MMMGPLGGGRQTNGRGRDGRGYPGSTDVVVACYFGFEFGEFLGFDVEDPFEIGTHLAFHLVDLTSGEHAFTDDAP